jgi:outer membrane protein insertion porin family
MVSCTLIRRAALCGALFIPLSVCAQTGPTATPEQAPKTAPQVQEVLPSYEGQNVTSLELAGQPELNVQTVLPLVSQRAGEPFSRAKVDASIAALQRTGQFHAVEIEIRPDAEGVRVLFVLQPAIYFGVYEFPGALDRFPYSRLLQVADYPPRGAYTSVDVERAQRLLETFFRRNGYFLAEVRPEIQTDKVHGLANVFFHTRLNRRAKFGQLDIRGTTPQETAHLEHVLRSWVARLRGSAIRPGKTYSLKTLENATRYLENQLMKEDHLAGQVKLIGANYDPETNRADVQFNVTPGPLVHVRVQGAHLWSWTRHKLLPLYQQVGLDPELIQEGRQNLISYFQSKGYFNTKVVAQVQQQANGESVLYQVTKGPRHKITDVNIADNQQLSDKELSGFLKVRKARVFSRGLYSEKLVRTSVTNLKRVYEANGFSSVQITPEVKNREGNVAITFRVNEGPQDIVEALRLEGNTVPESQLAPQGLKLAAGQPYSTKRVDDDRNQIMAQYLRLGFLNATFRQTARQVGNDKHRLEVAYLINEGPRVETASIVTIGRKDTRQTLIDRTAQVKAGQPMREDELLTSESKLYNLGVFDWTEIDPRRQITTQTQEDVLVKVHEGKKNSLTYGVGFEVINRGGSVPSGTVALPNLPAVGLPSNFKTSEQTFWGPRGSLEYTRKNVRGKAETFTIGGLAARLDQRADLTFTDPHFRGTDWISTVTGSGEHNSENPIFTARQAEVGFQLQHALNADKTRNIFLRYGLRQTGITHLLIPDLVPPEDRHVRLSALTANYIRDTRDNVLDAHKGIYQSLQLDFNPKALGSSVDFVRLLGQTAYYKKIIKDVVWANSLRIGLQQPFAGSHVPLSELFFTGGGSTLRGFPLNGAGPQRQIPACGNPADPSTCAIITVPVGGRQLFILNSEFRIPVQADLPLVHQNLGLVAFYDGGNVYQHIGFHDFWAQYTNTIGLGLRYKTPVGPIRIDVGHNLNPLPGIKSTQFFVTLGQAF